MAKKESKNYTLTEILVTLVFLATLVIILRPFIIKIIDGFKETVSQQDYIE